MHGVKKGPPPSDAKVAERRKKAQTYKKLSEHALRAKRAGKSDDATFGVVEKLLAANPDVATFWNYRREMLLARGSVAAAPELALTAACLRKQPKSRARGVAIERATQEAPGGSRRRRGCHVDIPRARTGSRRDRPPTRVVDLYSRPAEA